MTSLTIDRFAEFFRALHGHDPYPWQERLAECAVNGVWPSAIDLPTGSGKTACIDIALFALACQAHADVHERTAPRRVFFCVNRRVVVDEAHGRALRIARAVWDAERNETDDRSVLRDVATKLRALSGTTVDDDTPPLDVLELRGGVYRDNRWARSVTQPTIVCTTIDQLGSRLLFRGYGVSPHAAPIQAALIAYDSLILLDEAHISTPFLQTLENVRRYLDPQKWAEEKIGVRTALVVPMTATPPKEIEPRNVISILPADRSDPRNQRLSQRLTARKPAELRAVNDVIKSAVDAATELAADKPVVVGVIVNRVATAKEVHRQLIELRTEALHRANARKRKIDCGATVELVIGSMRPIDRDAQADRLRAVVGPDRPAVTERTRFIVATQCLEVGADYDFDVLVTECASLDALRQRFGRLNRAGRRDADDKPIDARSVVLASKKDIKPEDKLDDDNPLDPIYGNALARTWNWLNERATEAEIDGRIVRTIDLGIDALDALLRRHGEDGRIPAGLLAPSGSMNAPVMLPAYVDFWCQTAPRPVPDPDVSLFLHGERRGEPDVQVCWRADLVEDSRMTRSNWCEVVCLLPPTSPECMSVPIDRLWTWLTETNAEQRTTRLMTRNDNDLHNASDEADVSAIPFRVDGVAWRGVRNSRRLSELARKGDLHPGDTVVLPVSANGSDELGHIPDLPSAPPESDADVEWRATAEYAGKPGALEDPMLETPDSEENGAIAEVVDAKIDGAEKAFQAARDRAALRLHPSLRKRLPEGDTINRLFDRAGDGDDPPTAGEWRNLLTAAAESLSNTHADLKTTLNHLARQAKGLIYERYPDGRGFVLTTRKRIGAAAVGLMPPLDEGEDEPSRTRREHEVLLIDHSQHVVNAVNGSLRQLPLNCRPDALELAARLHDLGKADERFQAVLRRTDRTDAWLLAGATAALLAKSPAMPMTRGQRNDACRRAGLPHGFRHELLSVQLAERAGRLPDDPTERDLILHLIAAHHGYARPFAPVVIDDDPDNPPPSVEVKVTDGKSMVIRSAERLARPPHRLDSGVAERFWSLTRRFGWWGLAYLEAVLRLADQQASAAEDDGDYDNTAADQPAEVIA